MLSTNSTGKATRVTRLINMTMDTQINNILIDQIKVATFNKSQENIWLFATD